jgi:hypothetical protein
VDQIQLAHLSRSLPMVGYPPSAGQDCEMSYRRARNRVTKPRASRRGGSSAGRDRAARIGLVGSSLLAGFRFPPDGARNLHPLVMDNDQARGRPII